MPYHHSPFLTISCILPLQIQVFKSLSSFYFRCYKVHEPNFRSLEMYTKGKRAGKEGK